MKKGHLTCLKDQMNMTWNLGDKSEHLAQNNKQIKQCRHCEQNGIPEVEHSVQGDNLISNAKDRCNQLEGSQLYRNERTPAAYSTVASSNGMASERDNCVTENPNSQSPSVINTKEKSVNKFFRKSAIARESSLPGKTTCLRRVESTSYLLPPTPTDLSPSQEIYFTPPDTYDEKNQNESPFVVVNDTKGRDGLPKPTAVSYHSRLEADGDGRARSSSLPNAEPSGWRLEHAAIRSSHRHSRQLRNIKQVCHTAQLLQNSIISKEPSLAIPFDIQSEKSDSNLTKKAGFSNILRNSAVIPEDLSGIESNKRQDDVRDCTKEHANHTPKNDASLQEKRQRLLSARDCKAVNEMPSACHRSNSFSTSRSSQTSTKEDVVQDIRTSRTYQEQGNPYVTNQPDQEGQRSNLNNPGVSPPASKQPYGIFESKPIQKEQEKNQSSSQSESQIISCTPRDDSSKHETKSDSLTKTSSVCNSSDKNDDIASQELQSVSGQVSKTNSKSRSAALATRQKHCDLLELEHVYKVYHRIAPQCDHVRHKAWPRVCRFLKDLQPGSLVADVGCGNGRYLSVNNHIVKFGSDICGPFLDQARNQGYEVAAATNFALPYRDGIFDAAISIGVIHHFASLERRVKALTELCRIVCPGGKLMIYVWAFEQTHRKFESQDVLIPWVRPEGKGLVRRNTVNCLVGRESQTPASRGVDVTTGENELEQQKSGEDHPNHARVSRKRDSQRGHAQRSSTAPRRRWRSVGDNIESPVTAETDMVPNANTRTFGVFDKRSSGDKVVFSVSSDEASSNEDPFGDDGEEESDSASFTKFFEQHLEGTVAADMTKLPNQLVSECRKLGMLLRKLSLKVNPGNSEASPQPDTNTGVCIDKKCCVSENNEEKSNTLSSNTDDICGLVDNCSNGKPCMGASKFVTETNDGEGFRQQAGHQSTGSVGDQLIEKSVLGNSSGGIQTSSSIENDCFSKEREADCLNMSGSSKENLPELKGIQENNNCGAVDPNRSDSLRRRGRFSSGHSPSEETDDSDNDLEVSRKGAYTLDIQDGHCSALSDGYATDVENLCHSPFGFRTPEPCQCSDYGTNNNMIPMKPVETSYQSIDTRLNAHNTVTVSTSSGDNTSISIDLPPSSKSSPVLQTKFKSCAVRVSCSSDGVDDDDSPERVRKPRVMQSQSYLQVTPHVLISSSADESDATSPGNLSPCSWSTGGRRTPSCKDDSSPSPCSSRPGLSIVALKKVSMGPCQNDGQSQLEKWVHSQQMKKAFSSNEDMSVTPETPKGNRNQNLPHIQIQALHGDGSLKPHCLSENSLHGSQEDQQDDFLAASPDSSRHRAYSDAAAARAEIRPRSYLNSDSAFSDSHRTSSVATPTLKTPSSVGGAMSDYNTSTEVLFAPSDVAENSDVFRDNDSVFTPDKQDNNGNLSDFLLQSRITIRRCGYDTPQNIYSKSHPFSGSEDSETLDPRCDEQYQKPIQIQDSMDKDDIVAISEDMYLVEVEVNGDDQSRVNDTESHTVRKIINRFLRVFSDQPNNHRLPGSYNQESSSPTKRLEEDENSTGNVENKPYQSLTSSSEENMDEENASKSSETSDTTTTCISSPTCSRLDLTKVEERNQHKTAGNNKYEHQTGHNALMVKSNKHRKKTSRSVTEPEEQRSVRSIVRSLAQIWSHVFRGNDPVRYPMLSPESRDGSDRKGFEPINKDKAMRDMFVKDRSCLSSLQGAQRPQSLDFSRKRPLHRGKRRSVFSIRTPTCEGDAQALGMKNIDEMVQLENHIDLVTALDLLSEGAKEETILCRLDHSAKLIFAEMKKLDFAVREFPNSSLDQSEKMSTIATVGTLESITDFETENQTPKSQVLETNPSATKSHGTPTSRRQSKISGLRRRYSDILPTSTLRARRSRGMVHLKPPNWTFGYNSPSQEWPMMQTVNGKDDEASFDQTRENKMYRTHNIDVTKEEKPSVQLVKCAKSYICDIQPPNSQAEGVSPKGQNLRNSDQATTFDNSENFKPIKKRDLSRYHNRTKDMTNSINKETNSIIDQCSTSEPLSSSFERESNQTPTNNFQFNTQQSCKAPQPQTPLQKLISKEENSKSASTLVSASSKPAMSVDKPKPSTDSQGGNIQGDSSLSRYYHVFKAGELDGLIRDYVPSLRIVDIFYDHANWCIVAEKIST